MIVSGAIILLLSEATLSLAAGPSAWWQRASDPVLNISTQSTKDATMGVDTASGKYILAYSAFYDDVDPNTGKTETISHVVGVLTDDFAAYGSAVLNISGHDRKWKGMCSPNFYEAPSGAPMPSSARGKYIVTINSWGDISGRPNQLFYVTSEDLKTWSDYAPLAASRTAGDRAIDAAVAWIPVLSASASGRAGQQQSASSSNRWVLAYKDGAGLTRFGVSDALDGNFTDPLDGKLPEFYYEGGKPSYATHENFEFFHGPDGDLRIVTSDYGSGTSGRETWIYRQDKEGDLSKWVDGALVPVPKQSFNGDDNSNAGYVADWRSIGETGSKAGNEGGDGYYYMVWAGNNNHGSFSGRGHNELGMSRSKDLKNWEVLPESRARRSPHS